MPNTSDSPTGDAHIRCEIAGRFGVITLDRPQALNALTLPMIRTMHGRLEQWRTDDRVGAILLKANGKAFCAGGDIRAVRAASLAGDHAANRAFFAEEYALNAAIHRYPKPYLSLIDGVCMGGGLGLTVHGRYRVVTERVVMAMPETAIGFFPDVGASHFLAALPGALGLYLGLTGARLDAGDARSCGLATHFVPQAALAGLETDLLRNGRGIEDVLGEFSADPGPGTLAARQDRIDRHFSEITPEAIIQTLRREGGDWAEETLATLGAASPDSLRITARLITWAKGRPLETCLERELETALALCRSADFLEGVRAMLVDKDKSPRWQTALGPRSGIAQVSPAPGTGQP